MFAVHGAIVSADSPWPAAVLNHLWQSTSVFLAIWLLAAMLHRAQARVRYRLWMMASVKFCLPFGVFLSLDRWVGMRYASWRFIAKPHDAALTAGVVRFSMPFPQQSAYPVNLSNAAAGSHASIGLALSLLATMWLCGAGIVVFLYVREWNRIRTLLRVTLPLGRVSGVPILAHEGSVEPGVVGIVRPRILIPSSLLQDFSPAQVDAILAHELCHIRRRDNLTAFLHMCITAVFWFHPAVWMIRARLLEEREQACDEAVLRAGSRPEVYAESILGVCRWYLESPVTPMAGVTGADLKRRVVRIMTGAIADRMSGRAKAAVAITSILVVGFAVAPGLFGDAVAAMQDADTAGLPRFAVVSIHPTHDDRGNCGLSKEGYHCETESLKALIESAYGIDKSYQIDHLPAWTNSTHYAIEAKVDGPDIPVIEKLHYKQRLHMLQPVLLDRFHLRAHWETRMLPVYLLTVAKGGSKLKPPSPDDALHPAKLGDAIGGPGSVIQGVNGQTIGQSVPLSMIVQILNAYTEHKIIDRTGLNGSYDFSVQFPGPKRGPDGSILVGGASESMVSAEQTAEADPSSSATLFTAVADMGLELKPGRAPLPVLVIDEIQPPSEN